MYAVTSGDVALGILITVGCIIGFFGLLSLLWAMIVKDSGGNPFR